MTKAADNSAMAVLSWSILERMLREGWSVRLRQHQDRSGPNGSPLDSKQPLVYSVVLTKANPDDGFPLTARGRSPTLDDALAVAAIRACDIEGKC